MRDNFGGSFALAVARRKYSLGDGLVIAGLVSYGTWWLYFLAQGRFPPAPLRAITGLPAPSTGCTRSLEALLQGHLLDSFRWNPFSVPILLLLIVSVSWIGVQALRGRTLRLPNGFLGLWAALLLSAWIAKFILGPQYW
jgi:hypothetical protein